MIKDIKFNDTIHYPILPLIDAIEMINNINQSFAPFSGKISTADYCGVLMSCVAARITMVEDKEYTVTLLHNCLSMIDIVAEVKGIKA